MRLLRPVAGAFAAVVCFSMPAAFAQAAETVVHCPNLFDSAAGKMLGPTTVFISGNKFEKIEPGVQSADGVGAQRAKLYR